MIFVPNMPCLVKTFETGNVGIALSMTKIPNLPNLDLKLILPYLNPKLPGFANLESTIFKGLQSPFEPQLKIIKVIGILIEVAKELPKLLAFPAQLAIFIAEKIIKEIVDALKFLASFIPPSIDSITKLLVLPIQKYMVLPQIPSFNFPFAGFRIPFPKIGSPNFPPIPTLPGPFGIHMPPNLAVVLGILMVPINILLDFFKAVLKFLKAVLSAPLQLPVLLKELLQLPIKLLPTLDLIKKSIGLKEFPKPLLEFVQKAFKALLNLIKLLFGLPGGICPAK